MDTLAVLVRWATDAGHKQTYWDGAQDNGTYVDAETVVLKPVLEAMGKRLEGDGIVPLRVLRIYTRRLPLVGGVPSVALAGPVTRVPEGDYVVRQGILG